MVNPQLTWNGDQWGCACRNSEDIFGVFHERIIFYVQIVDMHTECTFGYDIDGKSAKYPEVEISWNYAKTFTL